MKGSSNRRLQTEEQQHAAAERVIWKRQIRIAKWLNWITAAAAVVGLFGLYFVRDSIIHADQANVDANRAWISFDSISISNGGPSSIVHGDNFYSPTVKLLNTGRTPALDVAYRILPKSTPARAVIMPFSAGDNTACDGLAPLKDHLVVAANGNAKIRPNAASFNPKYDGGKGDWLVYIQGCVAYTTFQKTHFTKFCVFLAPEPENVAIEDRGISMCDDGNSAD